MPNGHGGIPRFGAPLLILAIGAGLYFSGVLAGTAYLRPALLVLAGGFGWKLAVHLHAWDALERGGATASPEETTRARVKMILGSVVYASLAALVALLLTD